MVDVEDSGADTTEYLTHTSIDDSLTFDSPKDWSDISRDYNMADGNFVLAAPDAQSCYSGSPGVVAFTVTRSPQDQVAEEADAIQEFNACSTVGEVRPCSDDGRFTELG